MTPSKYRPRPRPAITTEEDDSENEENDEPRRGTRKRGVTEHYIPEIHVPKPRARAAKQKVLATNGRQGENGMETYCWSMCYVLMDFEAIWFNLQLNLYEGYKVIVVYFQS